MPMTLTRSLLSILIPGFIAIAPWALVSLPLVSSLLEVGNLSASVNALAFIAAAIAGTVLEGVSSSFEVAWDKERQGQLQVDENWYKYLARTFANEPVGYRYLSRLATTLYFELSMMFAVPVFFLGVSVLAILRFPDHFALLAAAPLVFMVASAYYLHKQARLTHEVICKTRKQLNARDHDGNLVRAAEGT